MRSAAARGRRREGVRDGEGMDGEQGDRLDARRFSTRHRHERPKRAELRSQLRLIEANARCEWGFEVCKPDFRLPSYLVPDECGMVAALMTGEAAEPADAVEILRLDRDDQE